ncbi:MAG: hypothetical protein IJ678_07890 [Kiritimatiellae bacterium]|nr:hypothetical protein [Kiritimatiellia bacterium]
MYYIEGTIDAIDLFNDTIRFSLLPASGHLLLCDDGSKKALFIESCSSNATMVESKKNANGKEIVWFSADKDLCGVLLSAKNNRNLVRLWCKNLETVSFGGFPIPPGTAYKAEGIRVF